MTTDGIDQRRRGKREKGEESVSKFLLQSRKHISNTSSLLNRTNMGQATLFASEAKT